MWPAPHPFSLDIISLVFHEIWVSMTSVYQRHVRSRLSWHVKLA